VITSMILGVVLLKECQQHRLKTVNVDLDRDWPAIVAATNYCRANFRTSPCLLKYEILEDGKPLAICGSGDDDKESVL